MKNSEQSFDIHISSSLEKDEIDVIMLSNFESNSIKSSKFNTILSDFDSGFFIKGDFLISEKSVSLDSF